MFALWSALAWSAPVLAPLAVLGDERWRAPGTLESLVVRGDRIWAATDEVVVGFDAQGQRAVTFPACPGGALYPGGRLAISPAGDRMAIPCGEVRVVALPGGNELWRTSGLTGTPSL